jgi:hypothetical protein
VKVDFKALKKLVIERTFLNNIKAIYDIPIANIIQKWQGNWNHEASVSILSFSQHNAGILVRAIRQEKEIKGIKIGKDYAKLSLFADDIILYLKDPKNSTKKTLRSHKYI